MLIKLSRRLGLWVLSWILLMTVWVISPSPARADKAVKAVALDPGSDMVNVVAIYETTPALQKGIASSVLKTSKSFFKKAPGFNSFAVFQSEDGTRVMTLTQWQDAASYEASLIQPVEDSSKSKKDKTPAAEPTHVAVYTVDQAQAPAGMMPSIRGKHALIQFSEITATSPADLDKILTTAEASLPSAAELYPAPYSAVLLKGVDDPTIALLANWGSADEFEDITALPTLSLLPDDVASLAQSDQHLYETVKIVSAKPEKEKTEKDDD
jgi:heme-degrading monooxygenase HmoA